MIFKIHKRKYKLDPIMTNTAKRIISEHLSRIKIRSEEMDIPRFYLTYVIMMYVVSSTILKSTTPEEIGAICNEKEKASLLGFFSHGNDIGTHFLEINDLFVCFRRHITDILKIIPKISLPFP